MSLLELEVDPSLLRTAIGLLATLDDGVGACLARHPSSLESVLAVLAALAPPPGGEGRHAGAGDFQHQQQQQQRDSKEAEAEAAWALISATVRALCGQQPETVSAEVLTLLSNSKDALCCNWAGGSGRLVRHQAYCLQRLTPLLRARPDYGSEQTAAALEEALQRCLESLRNEN